MKRAFRVSIQKERTHWRGRYACFHARHRSILANIKPAWLRVNDDPLNSLG